MKQNPIAQKHKIFHGNVFLIFVSGVGRFWCCLSLGCYDWHRLVEFNTQGRRMAYRSGILHMECRALPVDGVVWFWCSTSITHHQNTCLLPVVVCQTSWGRTHLFAHSVSRAALPCRDTFSKLTQQCKTVCVGKMTRCSRFIKAAEWTSNQSQ